MFRTGLKEGQCADEGRWTVEAQRHKYAAVRGEEDEVGNVRRYRARCEVFWGFLIFFAS